MANYPSSYQPGYSYTAFQQAQGDDSFPGTQVDTDLRSISNALNDVVAFVAQTLREDGTLQNNVVGMGALTAEVRAGIGQGVSELAAQAGVVLAEADSAATLASEKAAEAAASAASLVGSSVSSVAIQTGARSFTTQAGKFFFPGSYVVIVSAANSGNFMFGQVTGYTGTLLSVNVLAVGGSGTYADWNLYVSGARGATGPAGPAGSGAGDMLAANNLSDLESKPTSRTNLGVGSGDTVIFDKLRLNGGGAQIVLDADAANTMTLNASGMTGARTLNLPDADGTVATQEYVGGLLMPAGSVIDFAGSVAPAGWLLCGGQAVSRTTYAALFAAIGTQYGSGDGATTFNVPDVRGRVRAGRDNMDGTAANRLTGAGGSALAGTTLGAAGGSETHTLTSAQMPSHTHAASTASAGDHSHTLSQNQFSNAVGTGGVWVRGGTIASGSVPTIATAGAHTHTVTVNSTGGDGAHNNIQPTIIMNTIIKT